MKRRLFALAVGAALMGLTGAGSHAAALKVGIVGDQTGSADLEQSYRILAKGIETLKAHQVDLVLHVGDLVESSREEAEIRRNFHTAAALLSTLNVPWRITPGDHDVNPPVRSANSGDRSRETLFRELLATVAPLTGDHLYYSFDQGGHHFIALDALEHLHTDPRWGNIYLARISEEQRQWLRADLERHKGAAGTIVFLHQPLWYNWAGWAPVHQLLREYGVTAVFAGHFHYDQDDGEIDGVHYRVIGATGATIKNGSRHAGGMHQVAVLTLENRTAECTLFDAESGEAVQFTPRADADRVQAMDYVLGALSGFASDQFFLKNGKVVNDCASAQPAVTNIFAVGNPIDLPTTFAINHDPAVFALIAPRFAGGLCNGENNGLRCDLGPGAGIAVSNGSTASVCFARCPAPAAAGAAAAKEDGKPAWSAGVAAVKGLELQEHDRLQMQVRMSFQGQQGETTVWRNLQSQPLRQCPGNQP